MKVLPRAGPNGESRFSRLYICWGALERGFIEGCRPIVGVDGCHLTGPHRGVLLTAVAIDPNDCMYPFAYAIVDQEKYSTWKWFLKLIRSDLNIVRAGDYTMISDKQKGLIKAMEKVFLGVEHRFCVRHLYNNFKQQFKGLVLKEILWKAARSSTIPHFNSALEEMNDIDVKAYEWLASKPGENWSRSHFSTHPKCDMLLNNLCESFNACIKEARGQHILTMLEQIRIYLMDLVMRKRQAMRRKNCLICPKINTKVDKIRKLSHDWRPIYNGENGFEVVGLNAVRFEVDIIKRECGCKKWQLSGLPCVHGVAALHFMGYEPKKFVHECYKRETYMRTYSNILMPINGREMWEKTEQVVVIPPDVKVRVGKPRKARRRDPDELKEQSSKRTTMSRKGIKLRCKKCGKEGHNIRRCGKPEVVKVYKKPIWQERAEQVRVEPTSESSSDDEDQFTEVRVEANDDLREFREEEVRVREEKIRVELLDKIQSQDTWLQAMNNDGFRLPQPGNIRTEERSVGQGLTDDEFWDSVGHVNELWNIGNFEVGQSNASESAYGSAPTMHVEVKKTSKKQPVRRSTRIRNTPKKGLKVTGFYDLTVDEPNEDLHTQESVTKHGGTFKPNVELQTQETNVHSNKMLHVGIMKPTEEQTQRGHYMRKGVHYVSIEALKEEMAKNKQGQN